MVCDKKVVLLVTVMKYFRSHRYLLNNCHEETILYLFLFCLWQLNCSMCFGWLTVACLGGHTHIWFSIFPNFRKVGRFATSIDCPYATISASASGLDLARGPTFRVQAPLTTTPLPNPYLILCHCLLMCWTFRFDRKLASNSICD